MTPTQVESKLSSIVRQAEEIKKSYLPPASKDTKLWNLRLWYSFYKKRLLELQNAPKIDQTVLV